MRTQPDDLDPSLLQDALSRFWGLPDLTLTYQPVGFGSHHWRADADDGERWFVTVDAHDHRPGWEGSGPEESIEMLDRAMQTAAMLRERSGLDFVLAPLADQSGAVLRRIGETVYSIALFPFVDGTSGTYGVFASEEDRLATLELVARVHNATETIPGDLPRRDTLTIPRRADLMHAFRELGTPWTTGPCGEPTRHLLAVHREAILRAFSRYDDLANDVRSAAASWVVTHGEPHASNVLRDRNGRRRLLDWDTVALAPRERDLWMLLRPDQDGPQDWSSYLRLTGETEISDNAILLYRMWWDLAEVAEYTAQFRGPHEETEDMRLRWESLNEYLPINPEFLTE